ncbi:MAG: OmpA family protein [Myxococcota bacterium]|nr:OmpA family protein [Myxococcota bacterium]
MKFRVIVVFVLGIGVLPAMPVADAREGAVEFEVHSGAVMDGSVPRFVLKINEGLKTLEVWLRSAGGTVVHRNFKSLSVGKVLDVPLKQGPGEMSWSGVVKAMTTAGLPLETTTTFVAALMPRFQIDLKGDRVSLVDGWADFSYSNAPSKCSYQGLGKSGQVSGKLEFALAREGMNGRLSWAPVEGVKEMRFDCVDSHGQTAWFELKTWFFDVPHEEVLFPFGQWEIPAGEVEKLRASVATIVKVRKGIPDEVPVVLYIAGHTDLVGTASANLELSRKRARRIAAYFVESGVRIGVAFAGFGEGSPLVLTADEVASDLNRRVDYILSTHPPFKAPWQWAQKK